MFILPSNWIPLPLVNEKCRYILKNERCFTLPPHIKCLSTGHLRVLPRTLLTCLLKFNKKTKHSTFQENLASFRTRFAWNKSSSFDAPFNLKHQELHVNTISICQHVTWHAHQDKQSYRSCWTAKRLSWQQQFSSRPINKNKKVSFTDLVASQIL